jgi:hypothetical protein
MRQIACPIGHRRPRRDGRRRVWREADGRRPGARGDRLGTRAPRPRGQDGRPFVAATTPATPRLLVRSSPGLTRSRFDELVVSASADTGERLVPVRTRYALQDPALRAILRQYLAADLNVADAPKLLHLHPNSILYRLRAIARSRVATHAGRATCSSSLHPRRFSPSCATAEPSGPPDGSLLLERCTGITCETLSANKQVKGYKPCPRSSADRATAF